MPNHTSHKNSRRGGKSKKVGEKNKEREKIDDFEIVYRDILPLGCSPTHSMKKRGREGWQEFSEERERRRHTEGSHASSKTRRTQEKTAHIERKSGSVKDMLIGKQAK